MATRNWGKLFSVQRAIGWLDGSRIGNPSAKGTPQAQGKESGCQCSDWGLDLNSKGWYSPGSRTLSRRRRTRRRGFAAIGVAYWRRSVAGLGFEVSKVGVRPPTSLPWIRI